MSAAFDPQVKLALYAQSGIPEAWLVDLAADGIEVHRAPSPEGYRQSHAFRRGERLTPGAFPDLALAVEEVIG